MSEVKWQYSGFEVLSNRALYQVLQLRSEVFVVEQNCVFQDLDNFDEGSIHCLGWQNNTLVAYCRILPPKTKSPESSIGRVVTKQTVRRLGLGKILVANAIEYIEKHYPKQPILIGAQARLERFYSELGFKTISPEYLEDGIPHIDMLRACPA